MGFIYKIENQINHKLYIGKTLFTIDRRWNQHKRNAMDDKFNHMPLYHAMRKYGIDNFVISSLEEVSDISRLSEREQYWIKYFDTYNNGYNATRGGDGSVLYDYDAIWELWENGLNIKQISNVMGCRDQVVQTVLNLHNVSTEERIKRSYDNIEKTHSQYRRGVRQIDLSTGKVIATYKSVSEAAMNIGCDCSNISKLCIKSGIGYGYKWEYIDADYNKKDFTAKQVYQVDLNTGQILNIFSSISEAARFVGGDSSYISKVCKGIQKSSKGFGWKYMSDENI